MRIVNIYLWSSVKSLKTAETLNAAVGYIVQIQTSKGPAEVGKTVLLNDLYEKTTANHSEIVALRLALSRINIKCELHMYTENQYLASTIENGWLEQWKDNDWKTKTGKECANKEEWQQLDKFLEGNEIHFHVKENHEFKKWLKEEVEKNRQFIKWEGKK